MKCILYAHSLDAFSNPLSSLYNRTMNVTYQLGINTFKLGIVITKVKVIALQMVSHFIPSVSPSSSSMSRESKRLKQYKTKALLLGKHRSHVENLHVHIAPSVYAYVA